MIRTQIYLSYSQVKSLKQTALEERASVSEIIRSFIDKELSEKKAMRKTLKKKHVLDELLDLSKKMKMSGPSDLATNLDEYLYGDKK
ncbi:MAG: hypothetical protein Q8R11_01310 [bacterium]|nr:hypothetical protein [bacterium]